MAEEWWGEEGGRKGGSIAPRVLVAVVAPVRVLHVCPGLQEVNDSCVVVGLRELGFTDVRLNDGHLDLDDWA